MTTDTDDVAPGEDVSYRIEVGIEFCGDPQRGRVVIEDALDLLMDRLTNHPALIDATVDATFPEAMRVDHPGGEGQTGG